ncbi:MAG: DNA-3-methyladenine glycosylase 2 family protein [Frankiaceae bacterium]|nr:DNA-3-methyladenine glycosylase 2 family protein [Frankiaceae bacterium]MBV9872078.1 DNA-3-methyladenine glycosylase 2 family protein [Frankiaceae bacterium]
MPEVVSASTVWRPRFLVDARRTLSVLQHGGADPCHVGEADGSVWRASRMESGPVSYRVTQHGPQEIEVRAWGAGSAELIEGVPRLLGSADRPEEFVPGHPVLAAAHRRLVGLRIPHTGRVMESLIPAVLEQKVVGIDATASWRRLVNRYGERAPGPAPERLRTPPSAATWRSVPSWEWHRAGVDPRRARAAQVCAREGDRLERLAAAHPGAPAEVYRVLFALPGVGVWTAAEVGHRALGDADAIPFGDYHLAKDTGWALRGAPLAEHEVEEFFEPWRPHRWRAVRLLELTPGNRAPRRGPRMSRQDYRRI